VKVDLFLPVYQPEEVGPLARRAEELGFDGLWLAESRHNPFIALGLAAATTERILLGTDVAVALARSPMVTAHAAWDLQRLSRGRFVLGLGPQVRAHLERRFGVPADHPGPRMREYVLALRAIWRCWQEGAPLEFRGRFYALTLMTPFFNPGPIGYPKPPVFLAAVNPCMVRVAGEVADGLHVHPLNSRTYLERVVRPGVGKGLGRSGRNRRALQVVVPALVAVDEAGVVRVRRQVAYYGATAAYRLIFSVHGQADLADELRTLASRGRWAELESLVPDGLLSALAVVGPPEEVGRRLRERYLGLADRVAIYGLPRPLEDEAFWHRLIGDLRES
jgi:probable F420-dependent oxidoreductase